MTATSVSADRCAERCVLGKITDKNSFVRSSEPLGYFCQDCKRFTLIKIIPQLIMSIMFNASALYFTLVVGP